MCPRRLKAKTPYYACLVPTFKSGVQAGLGEPVDTGAPAPAWELNRNQPHAIRLPVYFQWSS